MKHHEWVPEIVEHQSTTTFLVLLELVSTLLDLLAYPRIGGECPKTSWEPLRWVEVLYVKNNCVSLPFDCVIRSLTLSRVLLVVRVEPEWQVLSCGIPFEQNFALCAGRFARLICRACAHDDPLLAASPDPATSRLAPDATPPVLAATPQRNPAPAPAPDSSASGTAPPPHGRTSPAGASKTPRHLGCRRA